MAKRVITFLLSVVMLITFSAPVSGFNADKHDDIMNTILFGDESYSKNQSEDVQNKVKMLETASYLAIDQYNENGAEKLKFLADQGVGNLPSTISEINFNSNSKHRSFTHRGWEHIYTNDKAHWNDGARKNILRSTVNKIFDFGFFEELNIGDFGIKEQMGEYCDKCDSFSALIYYIHILGDQIAAESYTSKDIIIPFVRARASKSNPDIVYELKKHFAIIFEDQKDSLVYKSLVRETKSIAKSARAIVKTTGGVNTEQKFTEYHQYEEEFIELLKMYIPTLLKKEEFFNKTFS